MRMSVRTGGIACVQVWRPPLRSVIPTVQHRWLNYVFLINNIVDPPDEAGLSGLPLRSSRLLHRAC